ncbi:IS110 family transposase [Sphingobium chlorophenolicum]|uniref:IS110 family transposase n=1 Tax=Sphingobium chlorophenolicum TaxID=46429 RepID=UPI0009DAE73D
MCGGLADGRHSAIWGRGSQIKTDRRDAVVLASLFRAGELTSIWVPDKEHEAKRDLVRARISAVETVRRVRQQLLSFLLRHGRTYNGGIKHRTKKHRCWLGDQRFDHPAQHIAFEEYKRAIEQAEDRRSRLEKQIETLLPNWSLHPVVAAMRTVIRVNVLAGEHHQSRQ